MLESSSGPKLPQTRAAVVASELRRLIQSGELAPGTRLRQMEIAKRIGVSTTPVREAFTALAREGLLRQDAHRGAVVRLPSQEEVRENYEIRVALESLATRLAAPNLTAAELDELDDVIKQMKQADSSHTYLALNRELHNRIYRAAKMPRLEQIINNLRDAAASYISVLESEDDPSYASQVQAEHESLVAALRARDADLAAAIAADHLRESANHIANSVARKEADES